MKKKKEKKITVHVGCPPDLREKLLKVAEDQERTLSQQCVFFLKLALGDWERKKS